MFPISTSVIDDAASSGRTIATYARLLQARGARLERVLLCASSREAQAKLLAIDTKISCENFIRGDYREIHLRDGCPFIPFSRRITSATIGSSNGNNSVELRLPATAIPGSIWQVLWLDKSIRAAIQSALVEIPVTLSQTIGRRAIVSDLAILADRATLWSTRKGYCDGAEFLTSAIA